MKSWTKFWIEAGEVCMFLHSHKPVIRDGCWDAQFDCCDDVLNWTSRTIFGPPEDWPPVGVLREYERSADGNTIRWVCDLRIKMKAVSKRLKLESGMYWDVGPLGLDGIRLSYGDAREEFGSVFIPHSELKAVVGILVDLIPAKEGEPEE